MAATQREHLREYVGDDRYADWIEDYLEFDLTPEQREICRALVNNRKVCIMGANGFGKTYAVVGSSIAFLMRNYPATVFGTSGNFGKMRRTFIADARDLFSTAKEYGLPGQFYKSRNRIEIPSEETHFWEVDKPRDVEELEGVHNKFLLGIIEEGDKDGVTHATVESMESLMTDRRDRLVMTCNPPEDETNVVADILSDPTWTVLRYSSFDSHNVKIDRGERQGEYVNGLVTLDEIKESWVSWNGEAWPGYEDALNSIERDDLSTAWYRRRLGELPPSTSESHRPFVISDVREAYSRLPATITDKPDAMAVDVARGSEGRGGGYTAFTGIFGDDLRVLGHWSAGNHVKNEQFLRDRIKPSWDCPLMIDAVGEGSALTDNVELWYANTHRFNAGATPADSENYRRCWDQGLYLLGKFLRRGGSISDESLREELFAAARSVEFDTRFMGGRNSTVLSATSKSAVSNRLERSPDLLDSSYMAAYALYTEQGDTYGDSWAW
jgi:hypothetical protein